MKLGRRAWLAGIGKRLSQAGRAPACGLALLAFASISSSVAPLGRNAGNIAPLTTYTLTPAPNADFAPARTGRELTDGRRASGHFWSGGESVGWENKSPVVYAQDFAAPTGIGAIEIGTGRSAKAGIDLPAQAFIYAADDDGRFSYLGDAMATGTTEESLAADGIRTIRFSFEPVHARGVRIVFYRDGPFLFLDEIRVLDAAAARPATGSIELGVIGQDAAARRVAAADLRAGQAPLGSDPARRLAWPLPLLNVASAAPSCIISRVSPWIDGTPGAILAASSLAGAVGVNAVSGWLVAAFRVENQTDEERAVALEPRLLDGVDGPRLSAAGYVLALDYSWRADVVAVGGTALLPPHSVALFLAEAQVLRAGEVHADISVSCGQERRDFDVAARAIRIDPAARPYGNAWSYLVPPTSGSLVCWPSFHQDFWVDTAVVPAAALPRKTDRQSAMLLREYLRVFASSRRILLFMDLADPSWPAGGGPLLDDALRSWWAQVSDVIREMGFKGEVALYPIDEVRRAQVARLNAAIRAFRRIAPGIPVFGTIDDPSLVRLVDLDKIQVLERVVPMLPPGITRTKEVQVYGTRFNSKTRSVSNYFRRLSWLAFGASLRGSGLWSMWDSSGAASPQLGWSDFGGPERDFSLLYAGADGCVDPSRRLLAWRRGLEDLAVLETCQRLDPGGDLRDAVRDFTSTEDRLAADYDARLASLVRGCSAGRGGAERQ